MRVVARARTGSGGGAVGRRVTADVGVTPPAGVGVIPPTIVGVRGCITGVGVGRGGGMSFMRVIDAGRGRTCEGVGGRPMRPNVGIGGVEIFTGAGGADVRGGGGALDARTMCDGIGGGDERIGRGGGCLDVRAGTGGGALRRTAIIVVVADVSATDELASPDGRARQRTAYAPGRHACWRPA